MDPLESLVNKTAYSRPTVPVRMRPYVFLQQSKSVRLDPVVPGENQVPTRLLPEGNVADGNRVTWGWRIRVIKIERAQPLTIFFNGTQIILPINMQEYELIDTTRNIGIDVTIYEVFSTDFPFFLHTQEQIMQVAPL